MGCTVSSLPTGIVRSSCNYNIIFFRFCLLTSVCEAQPVDIFYNHKVLYLVQFVKVVIFDPGYWKIESVIPFLTCLPYFCKGNKAADCSSAVAFSADQ